MLLKVCLVGALLAFTRCDEIREFELSDPFSQTHNFYPRLFDEMDTGDTVAATERDREQLDPNYKDPSPDSSEERPVLQPKPQSPAYGPAGLPGGVVDVDAGDVAFPEPGFGYGGYSGLFGGFFGGLNGLQPWWIGPNVCVEKEETIDDEDDEVVASGRNDTDSEETEKRPDFFQASLRFSNCRETDAKYECVTKTNNHGVVKTFTERYKCCYGFQRQPGTIGCRKALELKPLLETMEDVGAREFAELIDNADLDDQFENGNYTVFVPSDAALNEYREQMVELNNIDLKVESVRRRRDVKNALSLKHLVLSHAVGGFIDLTDLVNEEIINSENNNSTIRVNIYPTQNYRMTTVNCARITKANNQAQNGIVHQIDRVTPPVTLSIQDIIKEHPKLANLKQVLEKTDTFKNFKPDGHYTLFAPSDEAFDKLNDQTRTKLLNGDGCTISILRHHITTHTVCSSAIIGNATTHNSEGEILNMERKDDDQIVLEDRARIVDADIVATNGVVHIVDTILVPETALRVNEALNSQNLTKFTELIVRAGLVDEFEAMQNGTVFAPSNEAFDKPQMRKLLEEIGDDKDKLKDLVLYHTVQGQLQSCDMNNNAILKTNDHDQQIRLNLYSTMPFFRNVINRATVNCARLTGFDQKSCGSMIHKVSQVLTPPTSTILDQLKSNTKYSTLVNILAGTDVEELLQQSNNSLTFLAPTDETFAGIDEDDLKELIENKEKANEVLSNHVLHEVFCCSGVGPKTWGFDSLVETLARRHLQVERTGNHQVSFGGAVVTSCDNLATNGVVHTVNRVLFPYRKAVPNFGSLFYFNF